MPGSPHESNERNVPRDRLAGVTVESDFDYSWLSKEPPGYEDVADDGKVPPLTVKVGDEILYGKYSGTELNLEGKDYMIMRESDIYAVLN